MRSDVAAPVSSSKKPDLNAHVPASLWKMLQYQGFNPGNPDQIRADRGRGVMLDRRSISSIVVPTLVAAIGLGAQAQNSWKFADWSGQWDRVPDGGVPRYDPTKPIRKQQAPLRPEYQARFEASIKDQDEGGMGLELAYNCVGPGMPREMSGIAMMEFLISPAVTHILFDRNDYAPRRIYTDGRDWPESGRDDRTRPGYSIGRWI